MSQRMGSSVSGCVVGYHSATRSTLKAAVAWLGAAIVLASSAPAAAWKRPEPAQWGHTAPAQSGAPGLSRTVSSLEASRSRWLAGGQVGVTSGLATGNDLDTAVHGRFSLHYAYHRALQFYGGFEALNGDGHRTGANWTLGAMSTVGWGDFAVGGLAQVMLLAGAERNIPRGSATSAEFRLLTGYRPKLGDLGKPLRLHFNVGYRLDNSGHLVPDAAAAGDKVRYLSQVSAFDVLPATLGADVRFGRFSGFVEYAAEIPVGGEARGVSGWITPGIQVGLFEGAYLKASVPVGVSQGYLMPKVAPWLVHFAFSYTYSGHKKDPLNTPRRQTALSDPMAAWGGQSRSTAARAGRASGDGQNASEKAEEDGSPRLRGRPAEEASSDADSQNGAAGATTDGDSLTNGPVWRSRFSLVDEAQAARAAAAGSGLRGTEALADESPGGADAGTTIIRVDGDRLVLPQPVRFYVDQSTLLPASYGLLDRVATLLKAHPAMELVVEGHTASGDSQVFNFDLSWQRVESVRGYLVYRGIEAERIQVRGYGNTRPLVEDDSDEGKLRNDRIAFLVVGAPDASSADGGE